MFTGPVGPVEVFFYWPEAVLGNIYWPGAIGSPLSSSPVRTTKKIMPAKQMSVHYSGERKNVHYNEGVHFTLMDIHFLRFHCIVNLV